MKDLSDCRPSLLLLILVLALLLAPAPPPPLAAVEPAPEALGTSDFDFLLRAEYDRSVSTPRFYTIT